MSNALTNAIHTISADGSLSNFRRSELESTGYKVVNYPRGTRFTPLAYEVGTAYISRSTPNIEACYRWITTIASHTELLNGMPVRRSLLDSPAMASQSPGALAFYKSYDALMTDPNAIILASPFANRGGFDSFVVGAWLNRVFDRYVLQDVNLETELQDAQTLAKAYQGCTANIPPFIGEAVSEVQAYYKQYSDCAVKIDPSLKSMFGQ